MVFGSAALDNLPNYLKTRHQAAWRFGL